MHQTPIKNARFWTTLGTGAPCKISLKPGQSRYHQRLTHNGEGYTLTHITWHHRGDAVELHFVVNARDCDGPIYTHQDLLCPISRLHSREAFKGSGVPDLPSWTKEGERIHDYQAIAAGY